MEFTAREARLKPEFADHYPQVEAGVWVPAAEMGAQVLLWQVQQQGTAPWRPGSWTSATSSSGAAGIGERPPTADPRERSGVQRAGVRRGARARERSGVVKFLSRGKPPSSISRPSSV